MRSTLDWSLASHIEIRSPCGDPQATARIATPSRLGATLRWRLPLPFQFRLFCGCPSFRRRDHRANVQNLVHGMWSAAEASNPAATQFTRGYGRKM